ncbi:MAG TPA: M24 family metallopeptidase [Kofleriaceae bacterium]|nr:M24 family metallopeptidase [Kofleriaceae bacterium]
MKASAAGLLRPSPDAIPAADLDGFRRAQRVAYDAAVEVAAGLEPGITEVEAARRLGDAVRARGVTRYLHQPFAWFGERTRFAGFPRRATRAFFPTATALAPGMVAILDVAPVVDGYTADIGYTFRAPGGAPEDGALLDRAMDTLREIRAAIPPLVERGDTMRSIYARVDRLLEARGFENRHRRYPFAVLAHRVHKVTPGRGDPRLAGFGLAAAARLVGGELASRVPLLARKSPLWNGDERASRPVPPGLWAVEPHLGTRGGFGAKFEEILAVEPGRAWWLDDALPHVY